MIYVPNMIGLRYLCKKNRVVFIIEQTLCRTPNVIDLLKTSTTSKLTINRVVRMGRRRRSASAHGRAYVRLTDFTAQSGWRGESRRGCCREEMNLTTSKSVAPANWNWAVVVVCKIVVFYDLHSPRLTLMRRRDVVFERKRLSFPT